ncbi:hypothetical protein ARMSODRAFT_746114 [Armillaria solidipes]|uniref:Secreted protein n=1 Tax=Armillaria solidipes TaxID=1076256 RepID=A0A2H3BMR9_9AGAR|nr:hypothetical protein ARMSODRAFT_746114 [Armillaria solidipes]
MPLTKPFTTAVACKRFGPLLLTMLLYGWVKGEDVGYENNAGACSSAALRLCVRSPRSVGISIKAVVLRDLLPDFIYSIAKYARDRNDNRCSMALLTRGSLFEKLDTNCCAFQHTLLTHFDMPLTTVQAR